MRSLVGVLIGAALLFVVYYFYLKKMPTTDEGTAPTQAISLTGIRSDLLQIAQAERGYMATNGHCVSLDELISSNSLSMTRTERDAMAVRGHVAAFRLGDLQEVASNAGQADGLRRSGT